jgi:hypothetical protein
MNAVVFALLADLGRCFPLKLPQESGAFLPAVTFQQVSAIRRETMGSTLPVTRYRVQIDAWAETYEAVRALANAVDTRLNRYRGQVAGVDVLDVHRLNETELYESDTQRRRIACDYYIIIRSGE